MFAFFPRAVAPFALAAGLMMGTAMLVAAGGTAAADDKGKAGNKTKGNAKGKPKSDNPPKGPIAPPNPGAAQVIKPEVLRWILANNPGLPLNFLHSALPGTMIALPDGRSLPLYRLKPFHDANFRLTFFARKQEKGSEVVAVMEERLKKLMCLPDYYEFIMEHRREYKINGKTVSNREAYNHFRHIHRHLGVTAGEQYKAPVGGGSGIAAPSWAVWKAMNIFHHEACHCIGIGHDSGGLSGPLSGALKKWDHQKKWKYDVVDVNTMTVRP